MWKSVTGCEKLRLRAVGRALERSCRTSGLLSEIQRRLSPRLMYRRCECPPSPEDGSVSVRHGVCRSAVQVAQSCSALAMKHALHKWDFDKRSEDKGARDEDFASGRLPSNVRC